MNYIYFKATFLSRFIVLKVCFPRALTLGAVLALPPGVAHDLSALPAGEVAEGVVPGPAEHRAAVPVVVLVAHEAVRVLELRPAAGVQVLGPVVPHGQVPLGGHGADYAVWDLWRSGQ